MIRHCTAMRHAIAARHLIALVVACGIITVGTATAAPGGERAVTAPVAYVLNSPVKGTRLVTPNGSVTPVSTATNTAGKPIPVGKEADSLVFAPNGKTAYVLNNSYAEDGSPDNSVTPITVATGEAGEAIKLGKKSALEMAVTPNGQTLYVTTTAGVVPISTATDTAGATIKAGKAPSGIAIRAFGGNDA